MKGSRCVTTEEGFYGVRINNVPKHCRSLKERKDDRRLC